MTPSNTENAPSKPEEIAAPKPVAPVKPIAERPYSPGLEGVVAAETAIGYVDGANGRLLYRGYPIGQLVEKGTYGQVAELLWTGEWRKSARLVPAELPEPVMCALHELPDHTHPMDALRTAVSVWGAWRRPHWPPTVDQVRELTAFAPSALAAFHRLRNGLEPVKPNPKLSLAGGFLQQLNGKDPDPAAARALDAYFVVGAEHGLNASTFTCRVIISTRSDLASAVCGAIGCLKGPLHGGAPAEVVSQLHEIGSPEKADRWVREAIARGDKIMGFGHRVYRAYDPRAAALRKVAEGMSDMADWLRQGRGRRPAHLRRAQAGPHHQDQRRVLRGGGPAGCGFAAGPLPADVRARANGRLGRARDRAGRSRQAHSAGRPVRRPA